MGTLAGGDSRVLIRSAPAAGRPTRGRLLVPGPEARHKK
jgi:hypothetical protein